MTHDLGHFLTKQIFSKYKIYIKKKSNKRSFRTKIRFSTKKFNLRLADLDLITVSSVSDFLMDQVTLNAKTGSAIDTTKSNLISEPMVYLIVNILKIFLMF